MSPWKMGFIGAWIGVGVLLIADAVYIVLLATNKIKVKERPESAEEY